MTRICVCGAFRLGEQPKGGQEVKTCVLADALEQQLGKVYRIDTLAVNSRIKMPFQLLWAMITCSDIVMLPAHNGLLVLSKVLTILNLAFHKRLHYSVIGGWLQDYLPKYPSVANALRKFSGIYVETPTMMNCLKQSGFDNVYVVPNFKPLQIKRAEDIKMIFCEPYHLVTFSRVTEKKGVGIAADTVMALNEDYGRVVYTLDIYGPVDPGEDTEWFSKISSRFTSAIRYKGNVGFDRSVDTLSGYFALLFPTQYYTEGIPGTVIDSYAAGVPVIASRWRSFSDVIDDGITGIGYDFNDQNGLDTVLKAVISSPEKIVNMKTACLEKASEYMPEKAMKPILSRMNNC